MRINRMARSALRASAISVAVVLGSVASGVPHANATAVPKTPASTSSFHVYTMERNTNQPDLTQYGATRAVVVYDQYKYHCSATACTTEAGYLPSESQFRAMVRTYINEFGQGDASVPIVLDLEGINLSGLSAQAAAEAVPLWKQLLAWTHAEAPSAQVGIYSNDASTTNRSLKAQLYGPGLANIFAPTSYAEPGFTRAGWLSALNASIANDRAINTSMPIYPFLWSQHDTTGTPSVSAGDWDFMFSNVESRTNGAFIWEPAANDSTACGWLGEFAYEMGALTGTSTSGPLTAQPSIPSGSCTIPRGSTTRIPVSIKNTSSATTPATTMQSISGLPQGFTATWQYWDVPSLAPGASWKTTLIVTVPSSEQYSSTLLRMRTTISNTRLTLVIT